MARLRHPMAFLAALAGLVLAQQGDPPLVSTPKPNPAPAQPKAERGDEEGMAIHGVLLFAVANEADLKKDHPRVEASDKKMAATLAKVFPDYKFFQVLGEESETLFKAYGSWVVPSQEFFLKFDSKGRDEKGGILLDLQLWRGKKALVKTDAILKPDSPLILEGPVWGKGRLLFLVQLQERKGQ